jgi:hypothetical protein
MAVTGKIVVFPGALLMKKDAAYFEGHDPRLLFIAKGLGDAMRLESILTAAGIDYGVEPDEYRGGVIFPRTRVGAFFYVLPEHWESAVRLMAESGYRPAE